MSVRRRLCFQSLLVILFSFSICFGDINLLSNPGFENTADTNWVRRSCTFAYTTEQAHSGSYSGKASARTATWQGLQQSLLNKLKDGNSCTISAWARLDNAASDSVRITIQKTVDGNTTYDWVAGTTATNTGWAYMSGNYTLHAPGNLSSIYVYFEGPAVGVNFYVDDVNVSVQSYTAPPVVDNSVKSLQVWAQNYSGTKAASDYAQDIALDSAGNVYVTGYAKNIGTSYDFATIKYSPDGNTLWTRTYNSPGSSNDYAVAEAVDSNSDIVVAGCSVFPATGYDGTMVKYTTNGDLLWANTLNYPGDDIIYAVKTDSGRNIYVAGESDNNGVILKISPDGNPIWAKSIGPGYGFTALYSLALDSAGNVYACGETTSSTGDQDCLIVKYSTNSNPLWSKTYNGPANGYDLLESIVLDSSGNAYATGSIETAADSNYITMKYSPNGDSLWAASYGDTGSWNESYAITLASDGNPVVTGYSEGTTNADAATVKYNWQTGAQVWAQKFNGVSNSTDYAEAIASDNFGNVYVAGTSYQGSSMDYLTICYGSDGSQLWKMNYNGAASGMDIASAIAANGYNVYVTGRSADSKGNFDIATVRYSPVDVNVQADISIRYQTLEGFGAAGAWYENWLTDHPQKNTLYDILFGQLGLDIYRVRNTYQTDSGYISRSAQIAAGAAAFLGHPIKILVSSWSPPTNLKSNSQIYGGNNATLARDNYGNYVYDTFAQWWSDSVVNYRSAGLSPDYIAMQNEPDYDASWDSCRFDPTENSSVAGFSQAFDALSSKIALLPNPPKMLVPEVSGFTGSSGHPIADYINALSSDGRTAAYGYDHHLYNGGGSVDLPDGFIPAMTNFASTYNDKPVFQTELSRGDNTALTFDDAFNLALLIHNSLVVENAASYMYWELFWPSPKGLVSLTTSTYTINPVYYSFKHFSAFTDPNWQRIAVSTSGPNDLRISAYISPDNNQMSIVIINNSLNYFKLNQLAFNGYNITSGSIYRTSQNENCAFIGKYQQGSPLILPYKSIVTIAMGGNDPPSCSNPPAGDLNGDCEVNFLDIVALGSIYTNSQANRITLKNIADTWLTCGYNNQSDCWK